MSAFYSEVVRHTTPDRRQLRIAKSVLGRDGDRAERPTESADTSLIKLMQAVRRRIANRPWG